MSDQEEEEDDLAEREEEEFIKTVIEGGFFPPKSLTDEMISDGISMLRKTGSGLDYAYLRLDLPEMELTDISLLSNYIHLQYVDISKNHIHDLTPLCSMTYLLALRADENELFTTLLAEFPYLQLTTYSKNKITSFDVSVQQPLLGALKLSDNRITKFPSLDNVYPTLHTLDIKGNRITSTKNLDIKTLKNLYLADNRITQLEDLDKLPSLTVLHLRNNRIESLTGFSKENSSLKYLNLRSNNVSQLDEVKKLGCLEALKHLVLMENDVSKGDSYPMDVLVRVPSLQRLDKNKYSNADISESRRIAKALREEELRRKKEEEEERAEKERKRLEEEAQLLAAAEAEEESGSEPVETEGEISLPGREEHWGSPVASDSTFSVEDTDEGEGEESEDLEDEWSIRERGGGDDSLLR